MVAEERHTVADDPTLRAFAWHGQSGRANAIRHHEQRRSAATALSRVADREGRCERPPLAPIACKRGTKARKRWPLFAVCKASFPERPFEITGAPPEGPTWHGVVPACCAPLSPPHPRQQLPFDTCHPHRVWPFAAPSEATVDCDHVAST